MITNRLSEQIVILMYCVSKMASLLPEEINLKILNSFLYSEIIECNTHCFSYYWNSKLDSLEAKGNHLACIFARNVALKGTNSNQTSVMVQAGIFLNDKLEKLDREIWKLTSGKEKKIGKSTILGLIGRESSGLYQITIKSYQRLSNSQFSPQNGN